MKEDLFQLGIKAMIRNESGEILLLQTNPAHGHGNHQQHWDLPGGRVDRGEDPIQTLRRELKEELNLDSIEVKGNIGMAVSNFRLKLPDGQTSGLILSVYECALEPESSLKISDEHVDSAWFAPAKAADLLAVKYPPEFCELISQQ